ncbi:DUF397 domain-containing protein [Streptomyces sp. 3MP-14]|uniref:DUF397 domain-containing protein n=1 Tax=Streptomyces mimosae TaxID=2586635 RepID=A0A5N5ZSM2_9ACTN|nr:MULTISPECIES: DUF397 domain-containing protein [Streptomyces]KAB8159511.1 DUF397 domain-containing protein [Streptomyces mimosae]KAB8172789.1 DUF397 domain-containing protein [Streptomyces sp. 3MP-14]
MIRYHLPEDLWRSSSYSADNGGQCVEIQTVDAGDIAVGDSKDRARGAFVFAPAAWTSFVNHLKDEPVRH